MYVMLRLSIPSDAFVAAATGVAQAHRPRTLRRRAKFLQRSLKASLTIAECAVQILDAGGPASKPPGRPRVPPVDDEDDEW